MKKVKNQAYKTKLGHKRHLKAVARKGKRYTPKQFYRVKDGVIIDDTQHTKINIAPGASVETETLKL